MKSAKWLTILVLALGLMVCLAEVSEGAPMGTAFTYQGRLIDANGPADGLYDFEFRLFDDANVVDGNQVGEDVNKPDVDLIDGYFTVELDFGSSVFNGNAVWLETRVVRSPMGSNPATLSPLVELTPTPYAIYAKTAGGDGDWRISVNDMYAIPLGNVGIGTTSPDAKLSIQMPEGFIFRPSTVDGLVIKKALYNTANQLEVQDALGNTSFVVHNTGNVGIGATIPDEKLTVEGTIKSSNAELSGLAVYGHASGTGTNMGGYFRADGDTGRGVMGQGVGVSAFGVYGMADGIFGIGVFGQVSGSSGTNRGVYGKTNSPDGYAGYFEGGRNYFEGDVGIGTTSPQTKLDVEGLSDTDAIIKGTNTGSGYGVSGEHTNSGNYGYLGTVSSGVYGSSGSSNIGVHGSSSSGTGVYGRASATSGTNYGVYGRSESSSGRGVFGLNYASGNYGYLGGGSVGVYGYSDFGTAGYLSSSSGYGLIVESGNVGIGTTSPEAGLHIKGNGWPGSFILSDTSTVDNDSGIQFRENGIVKWHIFNEGANGDVLRISNTAWNPPVLTAHQSTGNVGIGTANPGSYKLYVNGNAYATGTWGTSDRRFKKNIESIESPLDKIKSIEGVSFEWKRSEYKDMGFAEGRHFGVIAQEVEKVLPEIVKEGPNGDKAVSYTELVPIMTEAIKQQQKQIEQQQKQIESLIQRIEILEVNEHHNGPTSEKEVQL
ncbi:MAG: tail fiber domain-containing protein [Planctomycetes bacterium]|nr:tail fiber domain-containing protein [Planctomycetota bacterium]